MATSNVAIQATATMYYGLRHPAGYELNAAGRGEWPADSFTFALLRDHVFEYADTPIVPAPVYAPTAQDVFFYVRDGRYVPVAAAALALVLSPPVSGGGTQASGVLDFSNPANSGLIAAIAA